MRGTAGLWIEESSSIVCPLGHLAPRATLSLPNAAGLAPIAAPSAVHRGVLGIAAPVANGTAASLPNAVPAASLNATAKQLVRHLANKGLAITLDNLDAHGQGAGGGHAGDGHDDQDAKNAGGLHVELV